MNKNKKTILLILATILIISCQPPQPVKKVEPTVKNNYIILLDLSDRLIVQENQPERDKEIIMSIYNIFKEKVKKELYIRSRDEIKVVIAPQKGDKIKKEIFEDRLYINMESIPNVLKSKKEAERTSHFKANLDTLYQKAVFSKIPTDYYGADIWQYFYEDLQTDYVKDDLTNNFLFILTDGYPIVGKNQEKLQPVKNTFPDLHVILVEAAPREKDLEWDKVMNMWTDWFNEINIEKYTLIKRKAISKEIEEMRDIVFSEE
ncbi:MAG: hypothetical protein JXB49_18520 [Bacteroidales bacterium]|nr:hypothetical protein [Bacteroidales bacterium]